MFWLKRNWNKKSKKTDNVHLEVVNPRICLLGEGRSFRSAPLVLWVSQVKNPVIISIVGISLQSATSSKGIYNRCGPRKNNLTHTDFDPIVEFKIFSRGFRTIFDMFIVQKCRCSLWSSNPIFISSANYTMRRNLPKTFSVLKFWINLLNFSLKNIWQTVKT